MAAGYDPAFGARPLKRTIQRELESPLGRKLLAGELHESRRVIVDYDVAGEALRFIEQPLESMAATA